MCVLLHLCVYVCVCACVWGGGGGGGGGGGALYKKPCHQGYPAFPCMHHELTPLVGKCAQFDLY